MMWWNDGFGYGTWIVMTLAMVAFWALVILGLVALIRDGRRRDAVRQSPRGSSADQILDERFARGEIDVEEYRARKAVLHPGR
ncbi:MAG TPA: SHOCT domain-containing protein [Intrasporangium sp.]|uniref:SHOCT domain-containing protein n=1 Tax=Intrasporangium sp. TaxID=1925024 RepID=UPI002D77691C|nr:SHOCT domain-containing protein [Intrasporangium sp.]HET7399395.1 SHOCT domain-containing protein [Intrasporangium sp.]